MLTAQLPTVPSRKGSAHPDEWAARVRLAACYRIFAMLGWTEMIYNHITVRLPDSVTGGEKQFLINPFGLHYSEVTASNLVKIDLKGDVLDGSPYPVNPAGFTLHSTHPWRHRRRALRDAHPHHRRRGRGLTARRPEPEQLLLGPAARHGGLPRRSRASPSTPRKAPRVLASIGNKPAVILRNHGLLSWGQTLAQAFAILWTLQRACEIQMATLSMGAAIPVPEAIAAKCTRDALQFNPAHGAGRDVFDALVRQVDRIDDRYKN